MMIIFIHWNDKTSSKYFFKPEKKRKENFTNLTKEIHIHIKR